MITLTARVVAMVMVSARLEGGMIPLFGNEGGSILYMTNGKSPYPIVDQRFAEQVFVDPRLERSKIGLGCEWIGGDPEDALVDFYLRGKFFDAVVILNDRPGRGAYCLHRGATAGLMSLVVKQSFVQIASPSHVKRVGCTDWRTIVDLPFVREDLGCISDEWVVGMDLLFSIPEGEICQWRMTRVVGTGKGSFAGIDYQVHWKSIWHDADQLDAILLPASFQCQYWDRMKALTQTPVYVIGDEWNYSRGCADPRAVGRLVNPVEQCRASDWRRIGIVPSDGDDGLRLLQQFAESMPTDGREFHFYHLRRDSCESLYEGARSQIMVGS